MSIGDEIRAAVLTATKDWAKIERQRIRNENAGQRAYERMLRAQHRERSIKEVVFDNMERVYATVSGGGKLPAGARQLFYAMRPIVLEELSDKNLDDQYFTQNLLPTYLQEYPDATQDWDVVFDARGHFTEPHTGRSVALGTLDVRGYLGEHTDALEDQPDPPSIPTEFPTCGPANRFSNVLFIEKDGFRPLLESARIATRFDLAIMSTKGMSSTAARTLIESSAGVRFLALHDFDKSGFSIISTLQRDTRRFQFRQSVEIVDLGLRLQDVVEEKLEGEPVTLRGDSPEENLRLNGATRDEIAYLTGDGTGQAQRVELNAMTSPQFIAWLERKLKQNGVAKFIPDQAVLVQAYRHAYVAQRLNTEIEKKHDALWEKVKSISVPRNLAAQVRRALSKNDSRPWDAVIAELALIAEDENL